MLQVRGTALASHARQTQNCMRETATLAHARQHAGHGGRGGEETKSKSTATPPTTQGRHGNDTDDTGYGRVPGSSQMEGHALVLTLRKTRLHCQTLFRRPDRMSQQCAPAVHPRCPSFGGLPNQLAILSFLSFFDTFLVLCAMTVRRSRSSAYPAHLLLGRLRTDLRPQAPRVGAKTACRQLLRPRHDQCSSSVTTPLVGPSGSGASRNAG